jgi:pimeloyl-ACP methyl ester carboxylesterase
MPDESCVAQITFGAQHFRCQRPPVFPTVFPDEDLRAIAAPTLLLVAAREVLYNPRRALKRARRLIRDLEADVIPDAGHFVSMEHADIVDRRVLEFLGVAKHRLEPAQPSSMGVQRTSEPGGLS